MSTRQPEPAYQRYPAYCFRASPTYNTWVKLTAADVQALRSEQEYRSQHIYFHLNHPIRFVRLVGVIVAIDDITTRYTNLTIDDGSGANVELKIVRLTPDVYNSVESPSNTVVDNVDVITRPGIFKVAVDGRPLDLGTVIKAKGTLAEFRGNKQLELKRISIVDTTDEEAQAWSEAAEFKRDVLSIPWRITSAEHKKITREIKRESRKIKQYEELKINHERKKREHQKMRDDYLAKREVKMEAKRQQMEALMNEGALI
ncbi:hypothetical protein P154DRAFT_543685 [Amniculicola lignicola CBS 123094]|uniref:CST complex subunit Stn1 N-terminal domain-containing protein n=1 Tax=Amniculicola lignicola CBS 123094 TaxID=1392246 RepID=A0A6A5WRA6_9PLEO|nr:hypothetical protein P154DRAFT_543685 [Amniculicola lignicola CBS 123094]